MVAVILELARSKGRGLAFVRTFRVIVAGQV